jgi:glycosyltransferase involved in cell wall biosynthesis
VKILWFSNYQFSKEDIKSSGTWLKVMGEALSKEKGIELINITAGQTNRMVSEQINGIQQYLVPISIGSLFKVPKSQIVWQVGKLIEDIQPDVIHVWGTESEWGLITRNYVNRFAVLLEIQGILAQIREHFYGGLTFKEILNCTGPREFVSPKSHLFFQYYLQKRRVKEEEDVIKGHNYISVQSEFSQRTIEVINSRAKIFHSLIPLREEFVLATRTWSHQKSGRIFTSIASLHAYKGIDVAIKALKTLIDNGFCGSLSIVGAQNTGIRQPGYKRYVLRLIKDLKLEENVNWLGALDAKQLVRELKSSDVVLIPSYMESYSMVLHESIAIGIPIVCSYAGAMPEARRLSSCIEFFQPGDYRVAASLLSDVLLCQHESNSGSLTVVTAETALQRQLSIYEKIITK